MFCNKNIVFFIVGILDFPYVCACAYAHLNYLELLPMVNASPLKIQQKRNP